VGHDVRRHLHGGHHPVALVNGGAAGIGHWSFVIGGLEVFGSSSAVLLK
jgi:hypothetical protein